MKYIHLKRNEIASVPLDNGTILISRNIDAIQRWYEVQVTYYNTKEFSQNLTSEEIKQYAEQYCKNNSVYVSEVYITYVNVFGNEH